VSLPAPPNNRSAPEPPVSTSLPAPPNSWAAGSAPLDSSSEIVSLPPLPNTWIVAVLATVAVPPLTGTVPPFTKICPAASRLVTMVLSTSSPVSDSKPGPGKNVALIAMIVVLSRIWPRRRCALAVNRVEP
jgi:hypothetical protein